MGLNNRTAPAQPGNKLIDVTHSQESQRLALGPSFESVVVADSAGILRYIYERGDIDERSIVDKRIPFIEVGGLVHIDKVDEVINPVVADEGGTPNTLSALGGQAISARMELTR